MSDDAQHDATMQRDRVRLKQAQTITTVTVIVFGVLLVVWVVSGAMVTNPVPFVITLVLGVAVTVSQVVVISGLRSRVRGSSSARP